MYWMVVMMCQFFTRKSCCLISGSAATKMEHAATCCLSSLVIQTLTDIFVKIIFTHKLFLKIHLTVSWLNLLPQPSLRYLFLPTIEIPHFFNILIGNVHSQSAPSVTYMLSCVNNLYHSQTSAFFTTFGPCASDSNADVSHALLPLLEKI